jgi:hypothetical protein
MKTEKLMAEILEVALVCIGAVVVVSPFIGVALPTEWQWVILIPIALFFFTIALYLFISFPRP